MVKRLLPFLLFLFVARAQNTAKFPGAVPSASDLGVARNRAETTLATGINASDTNIPVASSSGFAAGSFVTIDSEILAVCSIPDGAHLNVGVSSCPNADGRGIDTANGGGAAASHLASAKVQARIVAQNHNQLAAELRAIAKKLHDEVVNVRDFGALCDGSTDDTAAITAAIASGAKVVNFPKGDCHHTGIVVYNKEGITIHGAGSGQGSNAGTKLTYTGATNGVCFEWKSNRWSVLQDIYMDCADAGYGIKNWADMAVASSQKNRFTNLAIRGATGTPGRCIHVGWAATNPDVSQTDWDSVTLWGCPTGLYQDGTQTLLHVYRNFSVLAATTGMDFEGGDVRVEHATFTQPTTAVDDIKVGGSALWAYFTGNYHEIYAGRPSNATAYNFPTSGVRGYNTNFHDVRVLWLKTGSTPVYFNQGGPIQFDTVTFDSAGSGSGAVTIASAGSYKTFWRETNSIYTAGITRSVGASNTAYVRDYDTIAGTDPLGTGTKGGFYGTNLTFLLQKLYVGVSSEADTLASIETAGTMLTGNFKGYRVKDTAGNPITIASLASDNTAILGTYNTPAANGHVLFYVKGAEVGRVTPTTNDWSLGTNADDGYSKLQVGGQIRTSAVTFATLPACGGSIEGAFRAVTDSSTATWGATITGGGANHVYAYCNGTNWTVMGK